MDWKSKTSLQFLRNLSFNILGALFLGPLCFAELPPGLFESLEKIVNSHNESYQADVKKLEQAQQLIVAGDSFSDISLDKEYLKDAILYSDLSTLKGIRPGFSCDTEAFILNGLLKSFNDNQIVARITRKNDSIRQVFTRDLYFDLLRQKKCLPIFDFQTPFRGAQLTQTLKDKKLLSPKTKQQCLTLFDQLTRDPHLPYLCEIPSTVMKAREIKSQAKEGNFTLIQQNQSLINRSEVVLNNVSSFEIFYLSQLCENLHRPDNFCAPFLKEDFWSKVINGEFPEYKLSLKCQNLLKKEKLDKDDLKKCAMRLQKNPLLCLGPTQKAKQSLFPAEDCLQESKTLSVSKLITPFDDCPAMISNEAVINISRIYSHFYPDEKLPQGDCLYRSYKIAADLYQKYDDLDSWPFRFCYDSKVAQVRKCLPFIPGASVSDTLSEGRVVGSALKDIFPVPKNLTCKVIPRDEFRPLQLEYRVGCYIVSSSGPCQETNCSKQVYYDDQLVPGASFEGKFQLEYFPLTFTTKSHAFDHLFSRFNRKKSIKIKNFTEMNNFFAKRPKGIVHGEACLEDILPDRFKKLALNQCTPSLFIVSGIIEENQSIYLALTLAIDSVHAPRPILWNQVFNGLTALQAIHPLRSWNLYGLYSL